MSGQQGYSRRAFVAGAAAVPLAACATTESAPSAPGPAPTPSTPAPSTPSTPALVPVASSYPLIIDTSTYTQRYLPALKALGVRSIFRYYATAAQAEVPQKQLTLEERDAILDAGFSIGSVFQYYSNVAENIHAERGKQDAATALARAETFAQTKGSAIYFGIDFDWGPNDTAKRDNILAYFGEVGPAVTAAGYRVGVYGSGATCRLVLDSGHAVLAWLVNSPGHSGASTFYNSGKWRIFQNGLDVKVAGGIQIDTSILAPGQADFGQWGRGDVALPLAGSELVMKGRRFVAKKSAKLLSAADEGAAVIANTRFGKGRSVRMLATQGAWAQVDVNETGVASGWCRVAELTADMRVRPDYFAAD